LSHGMLLSRRRWLSVSTSSEFWPMAGCLPIRRCSACLAVCRRAYRTRIWRLWRATGRLRVSEWDVRRVKPDVTSAKAIARKASASRLQRAHRQECPEIAAKNPAASVADRRRKDRQEAKEQEDRGKTRSSFF